MADDNKEAKQNPQYLDGQQPDLGLIGDDEKRSPETVAEDDVQFRAGNIQRQQAEFKVKQKSVLQKQLEALPQKLLSFIMFLWRGWHKWVLIGVTVLLLSGAGWLIWWNMGAEDRAGIEEVAAIEDRMAVGQDVLRRASEQFQLDDETGGLIGALSIFDKAFTEHTDEEVRTDVLINRGAFLIMQALFTEALEPYLEAEQREMTPDQAVRVYFGLSLIHRELGNDELADEFAEKEARANDEWGGFGG